MGVRGLYTLISVRIWETCLNKRNRILGGFDRNVLKLFYNIGDSFCYS